MRPARWCVAALALGASLASTPAAAQVAGAGSVPVERFRLAMDRHGVLDVEWAAVPDQGTWELGFGLSRADDPLVAYDEVDGTRTRIGSLVSQRTTGALVAAYALRDWVQLGLELPVVLSQSADTIDVLPMSDLGGFGLGDVRVMPKLELVRAGGLRQALHVAVIAGVTLPTGGGHDYRGDSGASLVPELVVSRAWSRTRLAANLGYRARQNTQLINLDVGDELFARLGAGYRLNEGGPPVELEVSLSVATAASAPFGSFNRDSFELLAGAAVDVGRVRLLAAGGVGVGGGFGTPDWRVVIGGRFSAPAHGDKTQPRAGAPREPRQPQEPRAPQELQEPRAPQVVDGCPGEDEDVDGFEDEDGCPDPDNDGDGVLDVVDECPLAAETANGYQDEDGCPDQAPDSDGDGVEDPADQCPLQAEDEDGFEDEDGCPELDNDSDGVLDSVDRCPDVAGSARARGC